MSIFEIGLLIVGWVIVGWVIFLGMKLDRIIVILVEARTELNTLNRITLADQHWQIEKDRLDRKPER